MTTVTCSIGLSAPALAAPTNYHTADQILVNHFVLLDSGLLHITPVAPVTVVEVNGPVMGVVNGRTVPAYAETEPMGAPGDPTGPVKSCTIRVAAGAHGRVVVAADQAVRIDVERLHSVCFWTVAGNVTSSLRHVSPRSVQGSSSRSP